MSTTQALTRHIDREQARQQLAALGYKGGDKVFVRAFFPDTHPRKAEDKGRKAEATSLDQLITQATNFQADGRGIYFVVNGGGHKNDDVTTGRAIFYEHDNLDKAAQIELWKGLGLPEPSLQIDTGGKSIHSYWIFVTSIAIEKWLPLQAELLEFADADRSIKNPSRVMRLAGAWHSSGNQSLIINNSGKRYTYDELRAIIPTPTKTDSTLFQPKLQAIANATSNKPDCYDSIELPVPMPVPLLCTLGKENKGFLQGVSTQRNTSMATLARDLIGTANDFARLGQATSDDAHALFIDACRRCSSGGGWDEKEWNQIWKSAESSNPSASIDKASPDAVENCIKSWYWQEFGGKERSGRSSDRSPTKTKISMREAAEQAREILAREQNELATNIKLEEVRQAAGIGDYVWEHKIIKPLKRDMDAERFKLELLGLLQMEDAVERCRQIALLAPKYSMSAGTVKEAMATMKSRTQTAEVKVLTFDELLASESEALEWTVQELLPRGETILFVALPKVGKSKAAVDLAFCVVTGESRFLGREVRQGKVLLICPDASKQSLKSEMLKRGFRSQDSKNIRIMPRWSIDQMSVLEAELEDFQPDLVIIDSLKKITAGKEISENSAEFADNIIALNDMLGRYRASGVLIHHASKSNEAVGVAKARGSTAIVGACWGVWDLERIPKPDPNNKKKMIADPKCPKRIFTATSRDSEGLSLNIEFNPENNSYDFISEVGLDEAEAQQQQSYRERILAVLKKNQQRSVSGPELMELMEASKEQRGSIYTELGRMENKRLITSKPAPGNRRYNLYSLPDFDKTSTLSTVPVQTEISLPPPPHTLTVPIADYVSENYTEYGVDDSQQNSQQIVSNFSECASSKTAENITATGVDPIVSASSLSQGGGGVKSSPDTETGTVILEELAQQPIAQPEPTTEPPTPIAPPEPEIAPTAQPSQPKSNAQLVAELVNQIAAKLRKAITENDAGAVREITWNTKKQDSTGGLHLAVKACLTDTEKEACRSLANANWKQLQQQPVESPAQINDSITSSEPEVAEPIALPDNSQEPESVPLPATEPREPKSVESPAQPTDTSSAPEAQPEVEADPEVVEDVE